MGKRKPASGLAGGLHHVVSAAYANILRTHGVAILRGERGRL